MKACHVTSNRIAQGEHLTDHGSLVERLVTAHHVGTMQARWIASYALSNEDPTEYQDPARLVDTLYPGSRAALRPLHEAIVDRIAALGPDVIATSCEPMVPAHRKHVFARLRPKGGGVEVSLALADAEAKGRLSIDPRKPLPLPDDRSRAFQGSRPAGTIGETCTPSMRRELIAWIVGAKRPDPRARRGESSSPETKRRAAGSIDPAARVFVWYARRESNAKPPPSEGGTLSS